MVLTPRVIETKAKINNWNLIKSFYTAKERNKMKRQPMEWEKIFANDVTDKGLISKIYKQLIQLNITNTNNPVKNGQKIKIDISPKKTEMANRHR